MRARNCFTCKGVGQLLLELRCDLREPGLAAVDLVRNFDSVKHSIFGWVRNLFSGVLAGADRLWKRHKS